MAAAPHLECDVFGRVGSTPSMPTNYYVVDLRVHSYIGAGPIGFSELSRLGFWQRDGRFGTQSKSPMNKIPTEQEIEQLEKKLAVLRHEREEAKKTLLTAVNSDSFLSTLSKADLVALARRIQTKLTGGHRKVRGSKVPDDLKAQLMDAIRGNEYSLSQLSEIFNLSISYISRIKKEMKESGELVLNAYTDVPLRNKAGSEPNHAVA